MAPWFPRSETWAIYKSQTTSCTFGWKWIQHQTSRIYPCYNRKKPRKRFAHTAGRGTVQNATGGLTGFASRMEALSRVAAKSNAVYIAGNLYYVAVYSHRNSPMFVKSHFRDHLMTLCWIKLKTSLPSITNMLQPCKDGGQSLTDPGKWNEKSPQWNPYQSWKRNIYPRHSGRNDEIKKSAHSLKDYLRRGKILRDTTNDALS